MGYDQEARDRVARFVRDKFDAADIERLDRIIRNPGGGIVHDQGRSVSAKQLSFEERYPDAAKIRIAEIRR